MSTSPSAFPPLMPVYNRAEILFERGEGSCLYDDKGARYLDFVAGIAVAGLGHANPAIVKALKDQADRLWITGNVFRTGPCEKLARRLVDLTFADTVFFQNSGAEAWECSVKVLRKHFSAIGQPERWRILTFEGCFHGRTLAAIAASKAEKMVGGFGPMMDGFDQVPFGDLEAARAALRPDTAGIFVEPVQGEGGMRVAPPGFLEGLRRLCDERGLLLAFDEIQCGMGRTGRLFAHEAHGVVPDIMCIAKALGNGFPIAACLATASAAQGMTVGTHGSTYGGNPLATAVGNAVLDAMTKPGFLESVRQKGAHLETRLRELVARHPGVFTEWRGRGLMQGLVCVPTNTDLVAALRTEKLLMLAAGGNVLRMVPPLTVSEAEIDEAAAILDRVAATWTRR